LHWIKKLSIHHLQNWLKERNERICIIVFRTTL